MLQQPEVQMGNTLTEQQTTGEAFLFSPNQSPTIGKLAEALAKAQGMMQAAKKDSSNPFFNSRYADLATCWDCCREPLSQNGLAVIQTTRPTTDWSIQIVSTLAHASGEWICGELCLKPVKSDPQGIGSALTYARRYSLCALVGISPDDDDAEAAQGRGQGTARQGTAPQQTAQQARPASQQTPQGQQASNDPAKASEKQVKAIWAISKSKGMDAHQAARDALGRPVGSLNDLNGKDAGTIIDFLNKQ